MFTTPNKGGNTPNESTIAAKKQQKAIKDTCFGRIRFPSENKAAHLVITKDEKNGTIACEQFGMIEEDKCYRPLVLQALEDPQQTTTSQNNDLSQLPLPDFSYMQASSIRIGEKNVLVKTPRGTTMTSSRSYEIQKGDKKSTVLLFSPNRNLISYNERIHGNGKDTTLKRKLFDNQEAEIIKDIQLKLEVGERKEVELESENPNKKIKMGEFELKLRDVPLDRKKIKSQIRVMGKNAENAIREYIKKNTAYTKEKKDLLMLLVDAFKLEWLHGLAVSLSPEDFDPQNKENLGAAGKWMNTFMITLERLAGYFAAEYPSMVTVKPQFDMVPGSEEVIERIHYKVTVRKDDKTCSISNTINAIDLPGRHNWPSTTDAPQLIQIVESILGNTAPVQQDTFLIAKPRPK